MGSCLFNNVSFLSYFLTLMPSVNGWSVNFVIMSVFILSELDLNYIYIMYIYIMYIYIYEGHTSYHRYGASKIKKYTCDLGINFIEAILKKVFNLSNLNFNVRISCTNFPQWLVANIQK